MSIDSSKLHREFETLAETITAPGPIDVGRAIEAGHRRAARRRALQASGATAGVAATAAVVLTAVHVFGASATPAVAASPPPASSPAAAPGTPTDPIANPDSFGWLPKGMRANGYDFARATDTAPMTFEGISAEIGDSELLLSIASGPRPNLPLTTFPAKPPVYTPGPLINGHQSYVESYPGSNIGIGSVGTYYLMWQFDDGTWATLRATSHDAGTAVSADDILHVARTVTEKPFPIGQQFQITGPLADAEIVGATMKPDGSVDLVFQAGSARIDVTVEPGAIAGEDCKSGFGQGACVEVHGALPPSLAAGGAQGLLDDITLLQLPTTDVIKRS